jgi:hypothetical protein
VGIGAATEQVGAKGDRAAESAKSVSLHGVWHKSIKTTMNFADRLSGSSSQSSSSDGSASKKHKTTGTTPLNTTPTSPRTKLTWIRPC